VRSPVEQAMPGLIDRLDKYGAVLDRVGGAGFCSRTYYQALTISPRQTRPYCGRDQIHGCLAAVSVILTRFGSFCNK
jgi:hypothetical protein